MTSLERTADVVTGEIVAITAGRLSPGEVRERAAWLREVTKAALVEGVDYGVVPGTDRPSLLKPGAEVLLLAGGLGFSMAKVDDDDARQHRGVSYKCSVRRGDLILSECEGYAGYDESRYYRSAEDSERLERARAKQDRRPPREDRYLEYRAPWNTLVKMAQKRALVGATLNAVAGSGLFIDAGDTDEPPASRARPTRNQPPAAAGDDPERPF